MSTADILNERIARWLIQQTFYHGYLPREDLTFILKKRGDYIVRTTERPTPKGRRRELVLSVAWPESAQYDRINIKDIRNIMIERSSNGVYIDSNVKFPGLDSLFEFYKTNPIKVTKANAFMKLGKGVGLASWEYRHSQIMMVKKVGQGAYGEVFKGKLKKSKGRTLEVAVKTMKGDTDASDAKMKEVMAEARLMRLLNHPNIVRIRGIAVLEQPLYIIIDFINGGGLDSYLKKHANDLTTETKNKMAISAAWGIEFMHSQNIIHRDIAARNCLYDARNYVKLSDFGLSRKCDTYKMKEARKMPTKWMSPESLNTFVFTRASDVYTYGILLYEIYTCKEPYHGVNGGEAKKRILSGQFPLFEKESPAELWNIVKKKIYFVDQKKRSTMKEIVKTLEEWLQVELVLEAEEPEKEENDEPPGINQDSKRKKSKSDMAKTPKQQKQESCRNPKKAQTPVDNFKSTTTSMMTKDETKEVEIKEDFGDKRDKEEIKPQGDGSLNQGQPDDQKDSDMKNVGTDKKRRSGESDEKPSEEKMSASAEKVKSEQT